MPLPAPPPVNGCHSQAHYDAWVAAQAVASADQQGPWTDDEMLAWVRELRRHVHIITDADGNPALYLTRGVGVLTCFWHTTTAARQASVAIGTGQQWTPLYVENETPAAALSPYHDRVGVVVQAIGLGADPDQSARQPHERQRTIGVLVVARNNINGSYPVWLDAQYAHPPYAGPDTVVDAVIDENAGVHRTILNPSGLSPIW